jgi:hypothetical protein
MQGKCIAPLAVCEIVALQPAAEPLRMILKLRYFQVAVSDLLPQNQAGLLSSQSLAFR